jgi:hypothetical protein
MESTDDPREPNRTLIRGLSDDEVEALNQWARDEEQTRGLGTVSRNHLLLKIVRDALARRVAAARSDASVAA